MCVALEQELVDELEAHKHLLADLRQASDALVPALSQHDSGLLHERCSALDRRLAVGETLSRRYAAAGVTTLVGMQTRPQDTGLATAAIAGLVREFPAIDPGAYAAHAIRPGVRGDVRLDPPAFVDAMRAAVRLLEPAA